jgi:hypothetical protein
MKLNRSLLFLAMLFVSVTQAGWCGDCWCAKKDGKCPDWRPKNYTEKFIGSISIQKALNPYELTCNSYTRGCDTTPPLATNLGPDAVCAHHYSNSCNKYTIVNYNSSEEAIAAGAVITHFGQCGTCSTRQDLGVYMKY